MSEKSKSFFSFFSIGEYPPEFNPKVHGPYDPSRNYGKSKLSFCGYLAVCQLSVQGHNSQVVCHCSNWSGVQLPAFESQEKSDWQSYDALQTGSLSYSWIFGGRILVSMGTLQYNSN